MTIIAPIKIKDKYEINMGVTFTKDLILVNKDGRKHSGLYLIFLAQVLLGNIFPLLSGNGGENGSPSVD